jgi:LacI family transcriptional regulator
MKSSVSLTRIAEEAGVSKMTVSLALRRSRRIAAATQTRIIAIAERLGYTPNPEVGRLMSAIRHGKANERGCPLAYVTTGAPRGVWRNSFTELQYWHGANSRAREYGYYIDEYWADEPSMSEHRLSDILWHRGVQGIIVPPIFRTLRRETRELALHFDWKRFAAVAISDMLVDPPINRVIHDHYSSMLLACRTLTHLGYKRIGLCLQEHMDLTVNQRWQAAFRQHAVNQASSKNWLEPFIVASIDAGRLKLWIKAEQPDVLIGADRRMPDILRRIGYDPGAVLGYADMDVNSDDPMQQGISGIVQNSFTAGMAAVDLVVAAINRNEHGIPEHPLVLQVEGAWAERGSTPGVLGVTS